MTTVEHHYTPDGRGAWIPLQTHQLAALHTSGLYTCRESEDSMISWTGYSKDACTTLLQQGDHKALSEIQHVDTIVDRVSQETLGVPFPAAAVCGGAVSVPSYLAGDPRCFRRLVPSPQPAGVRVWIDIASSAGLSAEKLRTRGLAALGFARALSLYRPVEVMAFYYSDYYSHGLSSSNRGGHAIATIPLGCTPIDWTSACAIVGNCAPARWLLLGLRGVVLHGSALTGVPGQLPPDELRVLVGMRPGDVILRGAYLDRTDAWRDPEAWIRTELELFAKGERHAYVGGAR